MGIKYTKETLKIQKNKNYQTAGIVTNIQPNFSTVYLEFDRRSGEDSQEGRLDKQEREKQRYRRGKRGMQGLDDTRDRERRAPPTGLSPRRSPALTEARERVSDLTKRRGPKRVRWRGKKVRRNSRRKLMRSEREKKGGAEN